MTVDVASGMPLVMADQTTPTASTAAPAAGTTSPAAGASADAGTTDTSVTTAKEPASADAEPEGTIDESASTQQDVEAEEAEPATPDWGDPDSFKWDDWDGTPDGLPEPVRPWATKVSDWSKKKADARVNELESLRAAYEAILDGHEDPRLKDLQTKLDGEAKTRAQLEAEYRQVQAQVQAIEKWADEQETKRIEADLAKWRADNDWIFKDQRYIDAASKLVDKGWPHTLLPELVKLPESILNEATKLYERTKDHEVALRLAKAEAGIGKAKKPTTADFVAGTESPTVQARHTQTDLRRLPPREAAERAAKKAMIAFRAKR